jgi:glycosyltransferase involved in cell wall biosynthesis
MLPADATVIVAHRKRECWRMTFWIDVTTTASYPPPAVGIARVELNLAAQLATIDPTLRLCIYEAPLRRYSELPRADFLRLSAQHARDGLARERMALTVSRDDRAASGGLDVFGRGDVLVTCGLTWRSNVADMSRLFLFRQRIGLRLVTMCHDIITSRFPWFVPGMDIAFAPYMRDLARHSDHILCNSRHTHDDLRAWLRECKERVPPTSVMPMGSAIRQDGSPTAGDRIGALLRSPYLLCVSTIERRKNQQLLCRVYASLVAREAALPRLVLVGRLGEGGQELVDAIARDPALRDRVTLLSDASDAQLAALYRGCLFTLYPSHYEGWGLPVSESLALGKFVVSSDRGALPEAGGSFVDYADPNDVDRWAERIMHYVTFPDALRNRERDIRDRYRPTSWDDAARHVVSVAAALGVRSAPEP